jgi:DNA mismatch repair protein MutL
VSCFLQSRDDFGGNRSYRHNLQDGWNGVFLQLKRFLSARMDEKDIFMTAVIEHLSEHTINQIAAGEVIENPASIVKELVENAIDAGASKVVVEILGGGQLMVKVSDDGCGMGPEDALLCLERHATSKIKEADDLFHVATMGFRGEALASIAAVAKVSLQTAKEGVGSEVYVEGGEIKTVSPFGRNQGTTIEVRQLFYNVPARRKFQKSQSRSSAEITKAFSVLSLAHPGVAFELYSQEEEILKLPREEGEFTEALKARAGKVLGESFVEGCTVLDVSTSMFTLRGVLASCEGAKTNRTGQYQFVNARAVLCPAVSFAVRDAFGTRIKEGRFPSYVLHLEIAKEYVDVNVHPQKKEIRLREEGQIRREIQEKVQEALGIPSFYEAPPSFNLFSEESFFKKPEFEFEKVEPCKAPDPFEEEILVEQERPRPIGLYEHFLWVEGASVKGFSEELLLVDLKAAGARVLFDNLKGKKSRAESQMLLLPLTLPVTAMEEKSISALLQEITQIGYVLHPGRQTFLIEAIPSFLEEGEAVEFLRDFISLEVRGETLEERQDRRLATIASRIASRRGNHNFATAVALLEVLLKSSSPGLSPLGNKTIISVGTDELQQLFSSKKK